MECDVTSNGFTVLFCHLDGAYFIVVFICAFAHLHVGSVWEDYYGWDRLFSKDILGMT